MKIIQIAPGHHGARQIAEAFATVHLRKRGEIPQITYKDKNAWTDEEYDQAQAMHLRGVPRDQIARALKRTEKAVNGMIGWERKIAVSW